MEDRSSGFPLTERFCPCFLVSFGFPNAVSAILHCESSALSLSRHSVSVVEDTPLSQQEPCFIPETPPHSSGGGVAPGAEAAAAAELVRPPRAVPDGLGVALGAAAAEAMVTEEAAGWEPAATEVSVGLR